MPRSEIQVATSGTLYRGDTCVACTKGMLYRVDVDNEGEAVTEMFCGNPKCHLFLVEIR